MHLCVPLSTPRIKIKQTGKEEEEEEEEDSCCLIVGGKTHTHSLHLWLNASVSLHHRLLSPPPSPQS